MNVRSAATDPWLFSSKTSPPESVPARKQMRNRFVNVQDRVRVVVSEFEENLDKGAFKDPRDYAVANAEGKAREVS